MPQSMYFVSDQGKSELDSQLNNIYLAKTLSSIETIQLSADCGAMGIQPLLHIKRALESFSLSSCLTSSSVHFPETYQLPKLHFHANIAIGAVTLVILYITNQHSRVLFHIAALHSGKFCGFLCVYVGFHINITHIAILFLGINK